MTLADGTIMDSARLPESAVRGQPVTFSAESLMQSIASLPASTSAHPITLSGGSIMDSGGSIAPSQQMGSASAAEDVVQYHPIIVSDLPNLETTESHVLQGILLFSASSLQSLLHLGVYMCRWKIPASRYKFIQRAVVCIKSLPMATSGYDPSLGSYCHTCT